MPEDKTLRETFGALHVGSLLYVQEQEFQISERLFAPGDDPAFVSWKLVQNDGKQTQHLVIKFPNPKESKERFEEACKQICLQQKELERLRGVPSVPAYYPNQPVSVRSKIAGTAAVVLDHMMVRQFIYGMTLPDWMRRYEAAVSKVDVDAVTSFNGVRDVTTWFRLARAMIKALIPVHNRRVVHGDLRPRNIMMCSTGDNVPGKVLKDDLSNLSVRLLDTEELSPLFYYNDAGVDGKSIINEVGTFRRKYDSPLRCFEKKTVEGGFFATKINEQWFAPTDIFSLGMILFELALGSRASFGPFIEERAVKQSSAEMTSPIWYQVNAYQARNSNRQLKSLLLGSWEQRLRSMSTSEDVNLRTGMIRMSEVILACVRSHTDPMMADLVGILGILDEFEPVAADRTSVVRQSSNLQRVAETVDTFLDQDAAAIPTSLKQLVQRRRDRFLVQLNDLDAKGELPFFRFGGRAAILDTMVHLLHGLNEGDRCLALLTPTFFSSENMGLYGRVTSALQMACLRKVEIEWIIAVNSAQLQTRAVAEVLQQHQAAASAIALVNHEARYGIYYAIVDDPEGYDQILQHQSTSILIIRDGQEELLIAPDYHGEEGEISGIRIWPIKRRYPNGPYELERRTRALYAPFDIYSAEKMHVSTFAR